MLLVKGWISVIIIFFWCNALHSQDTTRPNFLVKNIESPKYQAYFQYFNPFQIDKDFYRYDGGFKWKHKSQKFFWKATFIAFKQTDPINYQILTFSPTMWLTLKRTPWLHLELSAGLSACRYQYLYAGSYDIHAYGLGLPLDLQLLFDLGKHFAISAHTGLWPHITYDIALDKSAPAWNNKLHDPIFVQGKPPVRLCLTFYF